MKPALITCGIYVYSTISEKMLVCHATNSPWNRWSIPKGLQDTGEDPYTAAVRELYEETGIRAENLHTLEIQALEPVKYQKQNKILESFLLITDTDLSKQLFVCESLTEKAVPEVDSWKWITLDQLEKWVHESQQKNIPFIRKLVTNRFAQ